MSMTIFKTDGYLVVGKPSEVAPDHVHQFWIFEHIGETADGQYLYGNAMEGGMWCEEDFKGQGLDAMGPVATGSVKWDECSNWDLQPDNVLVHFCDTDGVDRLGRVIKECILRARDLIPRSIGGLR